MNILREIGREYKAAGNIMLAGAMEQLHEMGIKNCHHDTRRALLLVYSEPASGERLLFEISASVYTGKLVIRYRGGEARAGGRCPACRVRWRKNCGRELVSAMRMLINTGV